MTDDQCIAIIAALVIATDRICEETYYCAKRAADDGGNWPDATDPGDPVKRANRLFAMVKSSR